MYTTGQDSVFTLLVFGLDKLNLYPRAEILINKDIH